jgi:hypothetical protein
MYLNDALRNVRNTVMANFTLHTDCKRGTTSQLKR